MNQESIKMPQDLPSQKKEQWKDIISIIFLIVFPFIGLILMWLLASWSKKTKVVITLVIIIVSVIMIVTIIGMTMVAIDLGEDARSRTRDSMRRGDMSNIIFLQILHHTRYGQYYSSINYPLVILLETMPVDPTTENPYGWIDNIMDPQKFCAYAVLEEEGWVTASHHKGLNECTDAKPTLNDCCFP